MAIVRSQLLYQGFIVSRWADEFDEARAQLAAWLAEGKLAAHGSMLCSSSGRIRGKARALRIAPPVTL